MPSTRHGAAESDPTPPPSGHRVLKKYPNRRLYDTRTSSYITLADVKLMVLAAEDFEVRDAKTGEELTRSILLQIILEEESAGVPMFSTQMLAQIIRFYGHTMQGMMGAYMEKNLQSFIDMQRSFTEQTGGLYEGKAFSPEAWSQFLLTVQNPMMQGFMSGSKSLIEQMQEQAKSLFPAVPGFGAKTGDKE